MDILLFVIEVCNFDAIECKRQGLITFPNPEKTVENTTRSRVFLMKYEVFGNVIKPCLEGLINLLNQN